MLFVRDVHLWVLFGVDKAVLHDAGEKARYLRNRFAGTLPSEVWRRQTLIVAVPVDFDRLAVGA